MEFPNPKSLEEELSDATMRIAELEESVKIHRDEIDMQATMINKQDDEIAELEEAVRRAQNQVIYCNKSSSAQAIRDMRTYYLMNNELPAGAVLGFVDFMRNYADKLEGRE